MFLRCISGCELLQKVYLCSNTNNYFCFNLTTTHRCELLQKVYLCSNTNNGGCALLHRGGVVNCFKKCIFAVIQTTVGAHFYTEVGL